MTTRALSFHASYACRESGACCTSGWPIEIEPDRLAAAKRAIAAGIVGVPRGPQPAARSLSPTLLPVVGGACIFYRSTDSARCALHHTLGHAALPLACRQFPRVVVIDPRGVSVTLSHYCPTAAGMLDTNAPVSIVTDAGAFPPGGEYVGLDVRDGLPPALRPDMLMDWDGWWHWEHQAIALLSANDDPADALARLACAVEVARDWRPDAGPLMARIDVAFLAAQGDMDAPRSVSYRADDAIADVMAAVPDAMHDDARRALETRSARVSTHAHRRLLIAHAFANWTAHLGEGLRTWLRSIEIAHVLLTSSLGVREVDLLLRHLADPRALAKRWGRVELLS